LHIAVIDITESETGFLLFVITNYLIISLQMCTTRRVAKDWSSGSGATTVGGAKQLQQGEWSDWSRGSEATTVGEQSDYRRGSKAIKAGGAKLLQQGEQSDLSRGITPNDIPF
jgi:hypothetical protein